MRAVSFLGAVAFTVTGGASVITGAVGFIDTGGVGGFGGRPDLPGIVGAPAIPIGFTVGNAPGAAPPKAFGVAGGGGGAEIRVDSFFGDVAEVGPIRT
ncbi:MAG: hypothetical protein M3O82_09005, partial [Verrucomicrobiota bacterium]|nr:hypothetical protein [Verrucomicrobiota bacterium]